MQAAGSHQACGTLSSILHSAGVLRFIDDLQLIWITLDSHKESDLRYLTA